MSINRLSRPVAAPPRPFEFVVSDVKGKLPSDINGYQYFISFICATTRWSVVYFLRRKSDAVKRFSEFLEFVKRQRDHEGNTLAVSRLLTDGGGEYGGKADANHADAETAKVLNELSKACSLLMGWRSALIGLSLRMLA